MCFQMIVFLVYWLCAVSVVREIRRALVSECNTPKMWLGVYGLCFIQEFKTACKVGVYIAQKRNAEHVNVCCWLAA